MEPAALFAPLSTEAMMQVRWITLLLIGCASPRRAPVPVPVPMVLGEFEDDYGGSYSISSEEWRHGSKARYRIAYWRPEQQYLIAQNDSGKPTERGLWSRVDWMPLPGMLPYTWGFCMTAYAAPTAAAAESTPAARREVPRTGCNGFPFSRMKRRPA